MVPVLIGLSSNFYLNFPGISCVFIKSDYILLLCISLLILDNDAFIYLALDDFLILKLFYLVFALSCDHFYYFSLIVYFINF